MAAARGLVHRAPIRLEEVALEGRKLAMFNTISNPLHESMKEEEIVVGREHRVEDFLVLVKMPQVGSRVVAADLAAALGVDLTEVPLVLRLLDRKGSVVREEQAIASHAGREDAVEEVDAVLYRLEDVLGSPDAHGRPPFRLRAEDSLR